MRQPELWLARHGETDWSAAGKHTGRTDLPLNDNGRAAARGLATVLAGQHFDLVLTSPLQRARDTCSLAGFGAQSELEPNLQEWDYGDYEGVTTDEIRESRPDWTIFDDGCPGGETLAEVGARADEVIRRVRRTDGRVIAFGHGHILRILAARWIDLAPVEGARLLLGTATVSVLGWERETAVISRWNAG
ncbi:MAG TPA: histidine phosphatase family protein [Mycobacteriales bacterium]|nr:histidine phosphatase family protein [Mycobacteriales bacterium]